MYNNKYLDIFIKSKAAPEMLSMNLFPNVKEITESYAMFNATTQLPSGFEWNNPNVDIYVVGDGHKPRTAAMFAYRTAWTCHSIDPNLPNIFYPTKRLSLHRKRIEDLVFKTDKNCIIVMPHSHAKMKDCLKQITTSAQRVVITMDCCVKNLIDGIPADDVYDDPHVHSPKNTVRVWKNVK